MLDADQCVAFGATVMAGLCCGEDVIVQPSPRIVEDEAIKLNAGLLNVETQPQDYFQGAVLPEEDVNEERKQGAIAKYSALNSYRLVGSNLQNPCLTSYFWYKQATKQVKPNYFSVLRNAIGNFIDAEVLILP